MLAIPTLAFLIILQSGRTVPAPVPAAPPVVADAAPAIDPARVKFGGILGDRYEASEKNRLLTIDERELLAGFQQKPGKQAWIGEHVGKWLNASVLTWRSTGDADLRKKIDRVRDALIACQEKDGYLGTYVTEKRFGLFNDSDWDVWVHKYCLIGLLTEYEYTGDAPSLAACRKIGDLLCNTFGPGKKSILQAGQHRGMAATSVLEPMVLLVRWTGEKRYLDFCNYIVSSWSEPGGPDILNALLAGKRVHEIGNGKAYEMLSNFVGLCELYRQTGERKYLQAVENGWGDIVKNQLYPTGSGSSFEHWQRDGARPIGPAANLCEVCVTVTWMQLNIQLFRLTAELKYMDEIERTAFNHLIGAQTSDGKNWSYFTPLEGKKPFSPDMTCCASSGPRGLALLPTIVATDIPGGVRVNLLAFVKLHFEAGGSRGEISNFSDYPFDGGLELFVKADAPRDVNIQVREPLGCKFTPAEGAKKLALKRRVDGLFEISQKTTDLASPIAARIDYELDKVMLSNSTNGESYYCFARGPVLISLFNTDVKSEPDLLYTFRRFLRPRSDVFPFDDPIKFSANPMSQRRFVFKGPRISDGDVYGLAMRGAVYNYIPFGDADNANAKYITCFYNKSTLESLPLSGYESWSRPGNVDGSICDFDPTTFRVTWDEKPALEDWYSVQVAKNFSRSQPVTRVVFRHGRTFHDGGWFDVQKGGKPRLEVYKIERDTWEKAGEFTTYPDTTATDAKGLQPGQAFEIVIPPTGCSKVRVVGAPACGDNPNQNFSSCAELEVYISDK
ncbi:MAG: glycoside hydrolase family 127 protein [Planctomycetes bacterium]|nr:glycoside hydrolase family 127 protein [Planctomycetota bacterium]